MTAGGEEEEEGVPRRRCGARTQRGVRGIRLELRPARRRYTCTRPGAGTDTEEEIGTSHRLIIPSYRCSLGAAGQRAWCGMQAAPAALEHLVIVPARGSAAALRPLRGGQRTKHCPATLYLPCPPRTYPPPPPRHRRPPPPSPSPQSAVRVSAAPPSPSPGPGAGSAPACSALVPPAQLAPRSGRTREWAPPALATHSSGTCCGERGARGQGSREGGGTSWRSPHLLAVQ